MILCDPSLTSIDLNLLVVFLRIYHERSLTLAARNLGVTQPAVSNSLARLRELFGDRLFRRSGRGVLPTPKAEEIAAQLCPAMKLLEKALVVNLKRPG